MGYSKELRTPEFKRKCVEEFRRLKAMPHAWNAEIAERIGVPHMTLYRWHREQQMYEDAGVPRPPKKKPGRKPKPKTTNEDA